jgi:hypothetical protein
MEERNGLNRLIGLALVGCAFIGIAAFVAALAAFVLGDATGAGVCLIASALAFGLLANALLRK